MEKLVMRFLMIFVFKLIKRLERIKQDMLLQRIELCIDQRLVAITTLQQKIMEEEQVLFHMSESKRSLIKKRCIQ